MRGGFRTPTGNGTAWRDTFDGIEKRLKAFEFEALFYA